MMTPSMQGLAIPTLGMRHRGEFGTGRNSFTVTQRCCTVFALPPKPKRQREHKRRARRIF
jgi:hypothetical protein